MWKSLTWGERQSKNAVNRVTYFLNDPLRNKFLDLIYTAKSFFQTNHVHQDNSNVKALVVASKAIGCVILLKIVLTDQMKDIAVSAVRMRIQDTVKYL